MSSGTCYRISGATSTTASTLTTGSDGHTPWPIRIRPRIGRHSYSVSIWRDSDRFASPTELNVTERVGRAAETVPTPRGVNGALVESHPPDDRMAHAQAIHGLRFFEIRGGCGCARVYGLPIFFVLFFFCARSDALSRERRSGSRTSRSSPAADLRPKGKHKQERHGRCA
jgi:hypothetical protein